MNKVDLAVLRLMSRWQPLKLADSDMVQARRFCLSGRDRYPLDLRRTVTDDHHFQRATEPQRLLSLGLLQTNAGNYPGNSAGVR